MRRLYIVLLTILLFSQQLFSGASFCCGAECGQNNVHFELNGVGSISTTTIRNGARSLRLNPVASTSWYQSITIATTNVWVWRVAVRFTTLPNVDCHVTTLNATSVTPAGIYFKQSDSKLYTGYGSSVITFGSTGVSVTTGQWYYIDAKVNLSANPWLIDGSVDGTSLAQASNAEAANNFTTIRVGPILSVTSDVFFDDIVVSNTSGDFPYADGFVYHFVPDSDGTHNVAGTNDFERGLTGTDITNATTTAYQLVDEVPMDEGTPDTDDFINMIAPPNSTDYVQVKIGPASGITTPVYAPRAVQVAVAVAALSATGNNAQIDLNDGGSLGNVTDATVGSTNCVYRTAQFSTKPSGGAWTINAFNALKIDCSTSDANPDPYVVSYMIEAEWSSTAPPDNPGRARRRTIQ